MSMFTAQWSVWMTKVDLYTYIAVGNYIMPRGNNHSHCHFFFIIYS